jgi:hypothetical protein
MYGELACCLEAVRCGAEDVGSAWGAARAEALVASDEAFARQLHVKPWTYPHPIGTSRKCTFFCEAW